MDRQIIFWKDGLVEDYDRPLLGNVRNVDNTLGEECDDTSSKKRSKDSVENPDDIVQANDFMNRYVRLKFVSIDPTETGQNSFVQRSTRGLDEDSAPLANGRTDSTDTSDCSVPGACDIKQKYQASPVFSCNGRHRGLHVRRSRCLLCISSRESDKRSSKRLRKLRKVLNNDVMCVLRRSHVIRECSLIDYCRGNVSRRITKVIIQDHLGDESDSSSTDAKSLKKRRIGTVENPLSDDSSIVRSVQSLIKRFSALLEEKKLHFDHGSLETARELNFPVGNVVSRRSEFERSSRNLKRNLKMSNDRGNNEVEDNEKYDEFNFIKLPTARSTNRSPQSDEGIEPDPDQRRAFVARCWSIDSAVPSDDDSFQSNQQQKGNEFRVTRCWSSDSAVLSDDEQNKAWGSSNSTDAAEGDINDGHPRYWRTPSVVVSDFSDYSYLEERFDRSNIEDKCDGNSGSPSPSQASSCSCLDCDEIRQSTESSLSLDFHLLQICRHRRHSDSCCLCVGSKNSGDLQSSATRRNSCLACPTPYYPKLTRSEGNSPTSRPSETHFRDNNSKSQVDLLNIPTSRKISDCSTNSSLSGDDFEITELQPVNNLRNSGWRKLRNIVQWTPFFQTYKKQRYPWVQLAGHQGNFRAGPTPGTILKKLCPQEEACFRLLMRDVLRPYVPEFKGVLDVRESENETNQDARLQTEPKTREATGDERKSVVSSYLQLQDLLADFEQPCVMDCKVGVRTYLESELAKAKERPKLRKDMYEKMVQVDPTAPTDEESRVEGVTKPRYMVWRETISSTATLGFRVEGIKRAQGGSTKDFKTTRTLEQVTEALKRFTEGYPHAIPKYLQRLKAIRATLKASTFFATHEVVGSSLLFVHDATNAGIWMIDFAKTLPLPSHLPRIRHDAEWQVGNHEDGYLIGINNLISIFQDIRNSGT